MVMSITKRTGHTPSLFNTNGDIVNTHAVLNSKFIRIIKKYTYLGNVSFVLKRVFFYKLNKPQSPLTSTNHATSVEIMIFVSHRYKAPGNSFNL
jgi:hypothetical protein